jgi:hypothetical protein
MAGQSVSRLLRPNYACDLPPRIKRRIGGIISRSALGSIYLSKAKQSIIRK